ncbi:cytochrome P450 93A2-like [Bidens hawaiensis]|uniref:cytochrome P450 93A2-like n=1 Tax=Bidens hawaiensis TaxID=980011 RepID=UPI00404B942F
MKKLVMSELLNGKTLDLLLPVRQSEVKQFVNSLSQKAKLVNLQSQMLMSESCSEEETEASDVRKLVTEISKITCELNLADYIWFLKNLDLQGYGKRVRRYTSALTIEWGLAELINHPIIMEKVVAEFDRVVGKFRLLEESDMPNLPYLQAVVKETPRLHPTCPMIPRTSTEDCTVGGYHISAKTTVFINVWPWGQHCHMLPFGSGKRMCPGTTLAMQMVQVTLGVMVQCFEWKAGEKGDVARVDTDDGPVITLPRANPLEYEM